MECLNESSDLGLGRILSCNRHSPWGWVRSVASRSQSGKEEETMSMNTYIYLVCVMGGVLATWNSHACLQEVQVGKNASLGNIILATIHESPSRM